MMIETEFEDNVPYASFVFDDEPGFVRPPAFGSSSNPVEPEMRAPLDHEPDNMNLSPRSAALASLVPRPPTLPGLIALPDSIRFV